MAGVEGLCPSPDPVGAVSATITGVLNQDSVDIKPETVVPSCSISPAKRADLVVEAHRARSRRECHRYVGVRVVGSLGSGPQ